MKKPAPHECGTGSSEYQLRWALPTACVTLSVRRETHSAYSTHEAASSSVTTTNQQLANCELQGANVLGLGSLGALGEVEFDLLVLVKRLVAA